MGSGSLYTYAQAAARLGRSKRSLHYYVKNGLIGKVMEGGEARLRAEDVEQLALDLGTDQPAMNRKTFFLLQAKVRKLEEGMAFMQKVLEIRERPLHPNPQEAKGYHEAASRYLAAKKWELKDIELWADQFDRMDEAFFDAVSAAVATPKPWEVFYRLCLAMLAFMAMEKKQPLALQALVKRVANGRKHLRTTILMWIEMGKGTVPVDVFRDLDGKGAAILHGLAGPGAKGPGLSA